MQKRETEQGIEQLDCAFTKAGELLRASSDLGEAMHEIIPLLGKTTRCCWGTFWSVDPAALVLVPLVTWSDPSVPTAKLESHTRGRRLSLSEGTAGHVWRSQKPIWTVDILRDMCIPRSLDAQSAGFQGGIWFALKSEHFVYGVVELLGKKVLQPTVDLRFSVERLGISLGTIIEASVALQGRS